MPARRRHRRPRPEPAPAQFVLDAAELLAPPPGRPDPHGGLPPVLWAAGTELLDWPAALADLYRHLLLPQITATGHTVRIAALGTRVVATHLDGVAILRAEPASVLRARPVLTGHRTTLPPAQVLAFVRLREDLVELLGPELSDPARGGTLDLRLVLAAAAAGFSAADVVAAHRTRTLTPDRIDLMAALLRPL